MNATELQTRLKNFAYRIVVLHKSLPPGKTPPIIEGEPSATVFSVSTNGKAPCRTKSGNPFKAKLSIAFIETGETLFRLASIVDLKLVSPAQLSSILNEADELTRIFLLQNLLSKKNRNINKL
jgi:four helix bundle protein